MVANPARAAAAPLVMLLSVWTDAGPGAHWHARLVLPDAQTHEFQSPLRWLSFWARTGAAWPQRKPMSPSARRRAWSACAEGPQPRQKTRCCVCPPGPLLFSNGHPPPARMALAAPAAGADHARHGP